MSTHSIKGQVFAYVHSDNTLSENLHFATHDMAAACNKFVKVCDHTIEVDLPEDFDPRKHILAALNAEKQAVRAEFAKRITELESRINNLLAIENEVAA